MISLLFPACSVLLVLWTSPTRAECPSPSDLDVMHNATHFIGAYIYMGEISRNAIQSCNRPVFKYYEGYDFTTSSGLEIAEHAWVVRRGCVVYEFSERAYRGTVTEYPSGVHPRIPEGTRSYKVRCNQEHFNCQPTDGFTTVMVCDATNSDVEMECDFYRSTGIKFSSSISNTVKEDTKLELTFGAILKQIFTFGIGISKSTGFDWTKASEETVDQSERVRVVAKAPPGKILKIEQAVGRCGGNQIRTEFFRISHTGVKGDQKVRTMKASETTSYLLNTGSKFDANYV